MKYHPTSSSPVLPPGMNDPLRTAEVAALFTVDPKTVTRWNDTGRLDCIRTPGGHRRYPWANVRALLKASMTPEGTTAAPVSRRNAAAASASATVRFGSGCTFALTRTPVAPEASGAGAVQLILGYTTGGKPVTVTVTRLEWLDDMESAIQIARVRGQVECDMKPALP